MKKSIFILRSLTHNSIVPEKSLIRHYSSKHTCLVEQEILLNLLIFNALFGWHR